VAPPQHARQHPSSPPFPGLSTARADQT
jgi:hypothetical protein